MENGRFLFFAGIFCVVSLCIVFQTFRSEKRSVFQQNLPNLSLRGGHFQCPTRQSETERDGIPERSTAKPVQNGVSEEAPMWCRLATNQNCRVAALLAMTQKRGVFVWKQMFCAICGHFLRSVAAHRLSNVPFRKSFRFPAKPTKFVIARSAATRQS